MSKKLPPRYTPDRDAKYMGLAWMHAGFSKDPNTQVGALIVSKDNIPLGSGYNGPPSTIRDDAFSWKRPVGDDFNDITKYDVVLHAEHNAIKHSDGFDMEGAVMYVTAFPCRKCMLEIAERKFDRVVYMDHRSDSGSTLQKTNERKISEEIARMASVNLEEYKGSVTWLYDWIRKMEKMGVFDTFNS